MLYLLSSSTFWPSLLQLKMFQQWEISKQFYNCKFPSGFFHLLFMPSDSTLRSWMFAGIYLQLVQVSSVIHVFRRWQWCHWVTAQIWVKFSLELKSHFVSSAKVSNSAGWHVAYPRSSKQTTGSVGPCDFCIQTLVWLLLGTGKPK